MNRLMAVVLLGYGIPLLVGRTFTDVGHFVALLVGFACHPVTRGRGGARDPGEVFAARRG